MQTQSDFKNLSAIEVLKYTSPFPLRVKSPDADKFVYRSVSEACISSGFVMTTFGFCIAIACYIHEIHKAGFWGDVWIFAQLSSFVLSMCAFLFLKKLKDHGRSQIRTTYLTLLFPMIFDSFVWGSMPILLVDKTGFVAAFYFVGVCIVIYGNSACITGLPWLSMIYGIVGSIPVLAFFYIQDLNFINIFITLLFYYFGTWGSANSLANGIISNAASQYALMGQSRINENLLNEFQIHSSDWVWETDAEHKIKFISIEAKEHSEVEMSDLKFTQLFDATDPSLTSLESYFYQNKPFDQLIMAFDPLVISNDKRIWELRGRPVFDEAKNFLGFRGFGRDITNIQELNDLIHSKDKFETMSKFVAKIAHDFNNSLMVIQSSVEILGHTDNDKHSDESQELINTVKDVVKSASRVNKELLSFARQEVLNPTTVDLYSVLLDLAKKYKLRAPDVEFIVRPFRPSLIYVDQYALVRTLENLFVNSIESMNQIGTITLSATSADWGKGSQVIFRLEDNGPGFSNAALKSASDPFFTTKKKIGGSGLGMAIAAGFIQQSGGKMRWGNLISGAFIEIQLPTAIGQKKSTQLSKFADAPNLISKRILIVDDDEKVLSSLGRQFNDVCGKVELANSIDAAIECVNASPTKFDIVLCDFQFDGDERHGVDLAEIIAGKTHFIIFMTGYSELSKELANYDVLPKPFSNQEFIETYNALSMRDSIGFRRQKIATS